MADYRDVLKELGPPPEAATEYSIFGIPFNTQAYQDAVIKRKLYEAEASARLGQQTNPLRDTTLGQLSELTNTPADELASKNQYRTTQYSEPSAVPSYRFMPTLPGEPQMGMTPGLTGRDREAYMSTLSPAEMDNRMDLPSYRAHMPQPTELAGPSEPIPSLRGRFEAQSGPPTQYSKTEVNRDAPSNLYQQSLGMSSLEREKKWPRMYGTGAATFQAKVQARAQGLIAAGMDPDSALHAAQLEMTGGTVEDKSAARENLRQRTDTGEARSRNLDAQTGMMPRRQGEIERHNQAMEGLKSQLLGMTAGWHEKMQAAQDNKDWIAIARLNESRYWHDQMMGVFGAVDKADIMDDEQKSAMKQGLGIVQQLEQRDPTPDELTLLESVFGQRPRYKYQGRKPLEGPTSQNGVAPPMARPQSSGATKPGQADTQPFADAPPGKNMGDKLKVDGKAVATWDGKTWQSMK
jgi:hypothetical protein